jgi:nitroimidazol reductase NimA-like FMN-containing flavoprotein (pyridoxamine 5'-phosphate oxidase superfamily)
MLIRTMTTLECTKLLDANRLCRIASAKDGQPYVVPAYFVHAENHLFMFSMLGKKVEFMRANPRVSVLVEEHSEHRQWKSVIVDGTYEELPDEIGHKRDRDHAWSILSKYNDWWEPGALKPLMPPASNEMKHVFFRVSIDQISGREAKE